MNIWLLFVLMAIGTYAWRLSFIYLFGKIELSERANRALHFVPPTVMLSLIFPSILRSQGTIDLSLDNPRFYAALVAGVVAYYTKNVLLTIAVGMGALFLIQGLF
jgi:branched-subunit amino acid transport protein